MKKTLGFTLIEILVVVTIIILLASGATVAYTQFSKQAKDAKRKTDLEMVRAALEMYRSNNDTYPLIGLSELTTPTNYLQSVPADPKPDTYSYYYSGSANDYTLGAYLENGGTVCVAAECGLDCNYCMGPYGQIIL